MKTRILLGLSVCAIGLFAQDRATLTGTVTDPSGARIPNASIKATNTSNNESSDGKTNADGLYTIPYLIPGVYDIVVTAPGFKELRREGVTLSVSQRLELPIQLTVGQATGEIVTVTG